MRDQSNRMPASFPKGARDVKPLTAEERRLAAASDNRQDPIKIGIPAWYDDAACKGVDMFPDSKGEAYGLIKAYCRECPVVRQCRRYAKDTATVGGVWGGLMFSEKRPGVPLEVQPRRSHWWAWLDGEVERPEPEPEPVREAPPRRTVPWTDVAEALERHGLYCTTRAALTRAVCEELGLSRNALDVAVKRHGWRFVA